MSGLQIYQASAGSGKTYQLVKEYLILALSSSSGFKNTLAITFTNKATAEMKSRVIEYLAEISKGNMKKLADDIKKELIKKFHKPDNFDVHAAAAKTLKLILHDYSNFLISTIDSFCLKIIRSFGKELGLQYGFDMELDTNIISEDITQKLLDKYSTNPELAEYLDDFIIYKLDDDKNWNIEYDITPIAKELFKEDYWETVFKKDGKIAYDNLNNANEFIKKIKSLKFDFENSLVKKATEVIEFAAKNQLDDEVFVQKSRGALSYARGIITKNNFEASKNIYKLYEEGKSYLKIKSGSEEYLKTSINDIIEYVDAHIKSYNTANAVFRTIYSIGIFSDLLKILDEYRKENKVILSSDINNILRRLISDDISPFIYEKIGAQVKNIMIDEFQDTSNFQWNNLKPLIINSLSERNTSLIVGDTKQSIYRWRNGDMRLLLNGVQKDLDAFNSIIKKEPLNENFRSEKEIVEFNNSFFREFAKKSASEESGIFSHWINETYDINSLEQSHRPEKSNGYININFFPYVKEKAKIITTYEESENKVLEIISELKNDNYEEKDILVLVRETKESVSISKKLIENGYEVISEKSLRINNSPKVKLILNILKYINNNKNILARAEILYNFLNVLKTDNKAPIVFQDTPEKYSDIFTKEIPSEFFQEDNKSRINSVLNELTVYELAEHIINIFELNKNADPFLIGFLNELNNFTLENSGDINSFLEFWEINKNKLSINIPETGKGIKVMTIHKAKGLQSKVIIIPYANWDFQTNNRKENFWASIDKEPFSEVPALFINMNKELSNSYLEEEYALYRTLGNIDNINLLYVAFTRPEKRLYINVPIKYNTSIANKIFELISSSDVFNKHLTDNKFEKGAKDKLPKEKEKEIFNTLSSMNSSLWYKKLFIKSSYKKFKDLNNEQTKFNINKGIIIHTLLSYIKFADDIETSVNKAVFDGIIPASEKITYEKLITKILSNNKIKEYFSRDWKIFNETDIIDIDGKIYRPDRILIKDNEAIIIDYKTGSESPDNEKQLHNYAKILTNMGYTKIDKFLWYIRNDENETIKVKEVK